MHLTEFVDKVYYINLNKRTDRKSYIEAQFEKVGVNDYERIEAIDFSEKENFNEVDLSYCSVYGCFDSHLRIYQQALDLGYNRIAVFEDDAYFTERYFKYSSYLFETLSWIPFWDVFHFWVRPRTTTFLDYKNIIQVDGTGRSHANILNKKAMEFVVDNKEKIKTTPFDDLLHYTDQLIKLACCNNLVVTIPGYSDIENRETYCPLD